jgi:hypothetical protein
MAARKCTWFEYLIIIFIVHVKTQVCQHSNLQDWLLQTLNKQYSILPYERGVF